MQMSTYSFDDAEGCFSYVSFRNVLVGGTYASPSLVYDDAAGTLINTFTGVATPGNINSYEIYVTLGDPSDVTTQQEFLLDTIV